MWYGCVYICGMYVKKIGYMCVVNVSISGVCMSMKSRKMLHGFVFIKLTAKYMHTESNCTREGHSIILRNLQIMKS